MNRQKLYALPKNAGNIKLSKEDFDSLYSLVLDNPAVFGIPTTRYYKVPMDMIKRYNPSYEPQQNLDILYYTKANDDPNDYSLIPTTTNTDEGISLVDAIQDKNERELYDELGYKLLPNVEVVAQGKPNNKRVQSNNQLTNLTSNSNNVLNSTGLTNSTNEFTNSGLNYTLPQFNIEPDSYVYSWEYYPFTSNFDQNLEETKPLVNVNLSNEEKTKIKKNYDLFSFLSYITNKNNNEELLKQLMKPKNYYDTPDNSIKLLNLGLNNTANQFNVLQQIQNLGTPIYEKESKYSNGGNVNLFDGSNKSKLQTKDKFSLIRPFNGKPRMSIGNYISIGRDDFLKMYPEFKERYDYIPQTEFMLIKDNGGYRPVRRTGLEAEELDKLYKEKYIDKGVSPVQTLEEVERQQHEKEAIKNIAEVGYQKALNENTLYPTDTPENISKIEAISEPIIESQWRQGIGHEIDVKNADEKVRKTLSIMPNFQDFIRQRLYKNVHPYHYDSAASRTFSAVALDRNARINPYNDPRDNIWAQYLRQPENIRYSKNNPEKSNYLGFSQYSPTKTSDVNAIYYDFPRTAQLNPRFSLYPNNKDNNIQDYSLINHLLDSKNGTIMGVNTGSNFDNTSPAKVALNYTASKNFDKNKGSYISIYDEWDLEPFSKNSGGKDIVSTFVGANPVHLYTRQYLDDIFLKNKERLPDDTSDNIKIYPDAKLGTYWLPQITVNGNQNANGGPLNIYRGGTNNLKLSDSTRRLLLSLPSDPRNLLRTKIPVAQSDVTGRINIDKKQEQARRTNTKKVIGAAARRRAAQDSYRYGENKWQYEYRKSKAEKDPEGYLKEAQRLDEIRELEQQAFISQEHRTPQQIAAGHEAALKRAEHEKRAQEEARANQLLDLTFRPLRLLSPSYLSGAIAMTGRGDDNFVSAILGDDNAGIPSVITKNGKQIEEEYPLSTFFTNSIADVLTTKGISTAISAASKASNVSKFANASKISKVSKIEPKAFVYDPQLGTYRYTGYRYPSSLDLFTPYFDRGINVGPVLDLSYLDRLKGNYNKFINKVSEIKTKANNVNLKENSSPVVSNNGQKYLVNERPVTNSDLEIVESLIDENKINGTPTINDEGYLQSLKQGNLEEADNILQHEYHKKTKDYSLLDSDNETPKIFVHTVSDNFDPNFIEFKPEISGRPQNRAIYTTDTEGTSMSDAYAKLRGTTKQEFYDKLRKQVNRDVGNNKIVSEIYKALSNADYVFASKLFDSLPFSQRKLLSGMFLNLFKKSTEKITNFKFNSADLQEMVNPNIRKHFWGKSENTYDINAKGRNWSNIWLNDPITGQPRRFTTNQIEREFIPRFNSDMIQIRNVRDYGPGIENDIGGTQYPARNVYIFKQPEQLKSSNIITFDKDGNIILPSNRFNFNKRSFNF